MKESIKRLSGILLIVVMAVVLIAGCGGTQDTEGDKTAENKEESGSDVLKIGVCMPTLQEERWQNDYNYFEAINEERDDIELMLQVADNDSAKQQTQIESLISQGVDGIICCPVDASSIGTALQNAHDAGIYVAAYCRLPENCEIDMITMFDNAEVGKLNAEYAYSLAPKGNYVLLNGDVGSTPDVTDYPKGWYGVLQDAIDKGDIKIVMEQYCESWSAESGMKNMEEALAANDNDIAAVICANDGVASGAMQALDSVGKNDGSVVVTGNDGDVTACKNIIAGLQACSTAQDTEKQAVLAVDTIVDLIKNDGEITNFEITDKYDNGVMEVPSITCSATLVTNEEEINKLLIDTGLRDKAAIYGN